MTNKKKASYSGRRGLAKTPAGDSVLRLNNVMQFQHEETEDKTANREPLQKVMMRLPQSLAQEFHQVYLALAARHLAEQGTKLLLQDCHVEMVREWIARQKKLLAG